MTPEPRPESASDSSALRNLGWVLLLCVIGAVSYVAGRGSSPQAEPAKVTTVERPAPSVLVAVQALARLQSVSFHMERIVDITRQEQALWGLVQAEDNILLVAVGEVTAGVDLGKLAPSDFTLDEATKTVRIALPPPEVFSSALDNERTYVHSRRTDALSKRDLQLETEARRRAERAIHDSALAAGILAQAQTNAATTVRSLASSFGYSMVLIDSQLE